MEHRILVAYATKRGSTAEVAAAVAEELRARGETVDLAAAGDVRGLDGYGAVVLGGALYMGRWHADARAFLARHREALERLPVAVFAIGPATLEEKNVADARTQLDRALRRAPAVAPVTVAIFGGVIDPAKLRFPFNRLAATDARDWDAICDWAADLPAALAAGLAVTAGP
jgi:menaquinone-dependent protoporphyrinogen oxidase